MTWDYITYVYYVFVVGAPVGLRFAHSGSDQRKVARTEEAVLTRSGTGNME
jgi:hypothetical protein